MLTQRAKKRGLSIQGSRSCRSPILPPGCPAELPWWDFLQKFQVLKGFPVTTRKRQGKRQQRQKKKGFWVNHRKKPKQSKRQKKTRKRPKKARKDTKRHEKDLKRQAILGEKWVFGVKTGI